MAQADYVVANQTFPNTRSEINTIFQAVVTNNAGNSEPSDTFANQWWFDSDDNKLYMRNKDNDAWVEILTIGATSDDVQSLFANVIAEGTSGTGVTVDGVLLKDGAFAATTASTITSSSAGDLLTLKSTDAGDNAGPQLVLHRDSASPANNDVIGRMRFEGEDNEGNKTVYAQFTSQIIDKGSSGGEDSTFQLEVFNNGAIRDILTVKGATNGLPEVIFNDASQDVNFRVGTDGNTHMIFTDGGQNRVGFGTSAPTQHTEIVLNSTGSIPTDSEIGSSNAGVAMGLGLHNESNSATYTGIAIETRTSQASRWLIANEWQSGYNGDLVFRARNGASTSTEVLRLTSGGIAIGGTASANTLDDYEEGTFTPSLVSTGATFAYTHRKGVYTKVGNAVTFNINIQLDGGGNSFSANSVDITGLPFNTANVSGQLYRYFIASRLVDVSGSGASGVVANLGASDTTMDILEFGDNNTSGDIASNQLSSSSGQLFVNGTYYV